MLKNKKILFLTPEFYTYPELIKASLESMGAVVDLFYNRPTSLTGKFSEVFLLKKYEIVKCRYFDHLISKTKSDYDYILIIRADLIPISHLLKIKNKYPGSVFIQYIWDDLHLFPKLIESFQYFDRILSYDLLESQKYGLIFRPFFFTEYGSLRKESYINGDKVFFIGSYHTDRLLIMQKIRELNPKIKFHFHLYINPITYILAKLPPKYLHYFRFWKMKYSDMLREIENSAAVLDIQNISQSGLTTRIFEALGAGSKIITVNRSILDYDFYNESNILLLDRNYPKIEQEWLDVPFMPYDESILKKYYIKQWVKEVFGV